MYRLANCAIQSLPDLAEAALRVLMVSLSLIGLGDFNTQTFNLASVS